MTDVDSYIAAQGSAQQEKLRELRALITDLVPEAGEKIAYGIPTFTLNGNLVHIGAGKKHVSLHPGADGVTLVIAEAQDLGLTTSKGTIQFPLTEPLPRGLIAKVVAFRAEQQRSHGRKA